MAASAPANATATAVTTPPTGLTDAEVADRVDRGLTNSAGTQTSRPLRDIIRANVVTPFNGLLGALAVVVLATGTPADALFGLVLVINSAVGIVQELRAKRTLDDLAVLSAPKTRVIRDGATLEIANDDVVLDDLMDLRTGDQVTADGTLSSGESLEVDESLLTGESEPVDKKPGDRVLSGSIVVAGSGQAQATAVGADSFASRLTADARRFSLTSSELNDGINRILKYVAIAILIVGPILIYSQTQTTSTWQAAVRGAVAGLVGMVPEGLVLLTTLTFFAAALTLARRKVLVRELPAVEGLARVDMLCLDKTGTLTEGDITFGRAERLGRVEGEEIEQALAALANDENANSTLRAVGEAFPNPPSDWSRTGAIPFSSARKWSGASFADRGTWVLGAPEMVLPGASAHDPVRAKANHLAEQGSRTLLLARADQQITAGQESLPANVVPVALITLEEKVRPDAAQTLQYFTEQGVGLRVLSGDNPRTVGAIAARVGLSEADHPFDARQLPDDTQEVRPIIERNAVFGRVVPQQKRTMVKALQADGHVVAMTGDGVNDALALKDADIGVAMGSGAPATRAVAQLVLLNDKFSVMPGVVAEGRRVIANVERVANLFLTKNVSSLLLSLSVSVAGWPFPFLPRHLTLVSGVAIGIPGFFLAIGPGGERFQSGFVRRVLSFAIPAGTIAAIAVMVTYGLARAQDAVPNEAKTAAAIVFLLVSLWVLIIQTRPFTKWRLALAAAMFGLGFLAFAIPFGRSFYDLHLPSLAVTLEALGIAGAGAVTLEIANKASMRFRRRS